MCYDEYMNTLAQFEAWEKSFKTEGFWNDSENRYPEYPMPVHSDEVLENKDIILAGLTGAEYATPCIGHMGFSVCRCCGENVGSREFVHIEFKWRWPQGLRHYIERHNIRPSDDFLREMLGMEV